MYNHTYTLKLSQWISFSVFHNLVRICENKNSDNWSENEVHYVVAKMKNAKNFSEPAFSRFREIKFPQKFQYIITAHTHMLCSDLH